MHKGLFIISVLGLIVAGYLAFEYQTGGPIVCNFAGGCDAVRESEYSSFLGISVPYYGVLFYVLLLIGAEIWNGEKGSVIFRLLALLTLSGLTVSAYLTYLEAFVIHAWCIWCVASAVISLTAFCVVWLLPKPDQN